MIFDELYEREGELTVAFRKAQPFPLLILDDFLPTQLAEGLYDEFPRVGEMSRSRDYVFGRKHESADVAARGPASRNFYEAMTSSPFAAFVSRLAGKDLFVDPQFHGGGFHQGGDGSFLDPHVDFNVHPLHPDWLRRINLLLYLSKNWKSEYGGYLQVRNGETGATREIEPKFNRALIMTTNETTYHGYEKMSLPPGVTRKSVATYAYELVSAGQVQARTTTWAPVNGGLAKRLLASRYNTLVQIKNRVLGSSTAKNR